MRNVVVLAVQTTKVATCTGNREALGAWVKVVEWLLLYRVNGQRTGFGIDFADKHSSIVATAVTDARLAVSNVAVMRTKLALNVIIVQFLIISTLMRGHNFQL